MNTEEYLQLDGGKNSQKNTGNTASGLWKRSQPDCGSTVLPGLLGCLKNNVAFILTVALLAQDKDDAAAAHRVILCCYRFANRSNVLLPGTNVHKLAVKPFRVISGNLEVVTPNQIVEFVKLSQTILDRNALVSLLVWLAVADFIAAQFCLIQELAVFTFCGRAPHQNHRAIRCNRFVGG